MPDTDAPHAPAFSLAERAEISDRVRAVAPLARVAFRGTGGADARAVAVQVMHPACPGAVLILPEQEQRLDRIEQWLDRDPAIQRMRAAPTPLRHPPVCLSFLAATDAYGWDRSTSAQVASFLAYDLELIDDTEREWLLTDFGA